MPHFDPGKQEASCRAPLHFTYGSVTQSGKAPGSTVLYGARSLLIRSCHLQSTDASWRADCYWRTARREDMVVTIMVIVWDVALPRRKINRMAMRRIEVRPPPRLLAHLHGSAVVMPCAATIFSSAARNCR